MPASSPSARVQDRVDANAPVIDARGVSKAYKLYPSPAAQAADLLGLNRLIPWSRTVYPEHQALHDVTLSLAHGERVGIIGRNGSGKTTLLKLISGMIAPTTGSISVNGKVQALMQVGVGFHPDYSGLENIRASLLYSGLDASELKAAEADIIDFCELGDFLGQPLKTYSLGMQARLQFACATAIKPEILIVDEILGAGDAYFSVKSNLRMQRLTKSGCTLLLVSHSMAQVLQFCDRAIWIDAGRVRSEGGSRKVVGEYEVFMEGLSAVIPGNTTARRGDNQSFKLKLQEIENPPPEPPALADLPASPTVPEALPVATESVEPGTAEVVTAESEPFVDRLANGEKVFRWASADGPKMLDFKLESNGEERRRFVEGDLIGFRCRVSNKSGAAVDCCYQVTIFSLDNRRLTRLLSPIDRYSGVIGETRDVLLQLTPSLLLAGNYYLNFAILPDNPMRAGAPLWRYDLISRFADFEITRTLDYRDGCIFQHPANWTIGATQ